MPRRTKTPDIPVFRDGTPHPQRRERSVREMMAATGPLTDGEIADLELAYRHGATREQAMAFAGVNTTRYMAFYCLEENDGWEASAMAMFAKSNACAKIAVGRDIEAGNPARGMEFLKSREGKALDSADWNVGDDEGSGQRRINSPITLLLMPDVAEKVRALDEAVRKRIIDAEYEPRETTGKIE